jgi:hypothetical protein
MQAEAPWTRLVRAVPVRGQLPGAAAPRRRLPALRRPAPLQPGQDRRRRGMHFCLFCLLVAFQTPSVCRVVPVALFSIANRFLTASLLIK